MSTNQHIVSPAHGQAGNACNSAAQLCAFPFPGTKHAARVFLTPLRDLLRESPPDAALSRLVSSEAADGVSAPYTYKHSEKRLPCTRLPVTQHSSLLPDQCMQSRQDTLVKRCILKGSLLHRISIHSCTDASPAPNMQL